MKKIVISTALVLVIIFVGVGIYNFPKGDRPIFSDGAIHIDEIVRRFYQSKFEYEWKPSKHISEKILTREDSDWEIYFGQGKFIPKKECICPEEKYVPWSKYPKEIKTGWESWDTMWGPKKSE